MEPARLSLLPPFQPQPRRKSFYLNRSFNGYAAVWTVLATRRVERFIAFPTVLPVAGIVYPDRALLVIFALKSKLM
jgi:hypothetical protein